MKKISYDAISKLGVTNQLIIKEAQSRSMEVDLISAPMSVFSIKPKGWSNPILLKNVLSRRTSSLGPAIADNKNTTEVIASRNNIKMPATEQYVDIDSALKFLDRLKSIVVKPYNESHGNGVTVEITNQDTLILALEKALSFSKSVVLQEHVQGYDVRLLFIGDSFAAAAIRTPARVVGDGVHTIQQLVTIENERDDRGPGYTKNLSAIPIKDVQEYLNEYEYTRVPGKNEKIQVIGPSNIGKGGEAEDVTADIDDSFVEIARKMYNACHMDIGGVDLMIGNPCLPESASNSAYFLEINAMPSFGLHKYPHKGSSVDVERVFLDWLLESHKES